MEILNTILHYLPTIIIGVICGWFIVELLIGEKAKAKKWLEWAVVEAEKALGSGTGKLKIRQVYDWFVVKFKFFSSIVPYATFELWVDEALETMKQLLTNDKINEYVNDKTNDKE